jgi:hypothetical protein
MMVRWKAALPALAGLAVMGQGPAPAPQRPACEVPPFRGGPAGQYTDAVMRVVNTGGTCRIRLFAQVETQRPYDSITLLRAPEHGTVTVLPDAVTYRPNRGFAGRDVFEVRAAGTGRTGASLTTLLRVDVTVTAPP